MSTGAPGPGFPPMSDQGGQGVPGWPSSVPPMPSNDFQTHMGDPAAQLVKIIGAAIDSGGRPDVYQSLVDSRSLPASRAEMGALVTAVHKTDPRQMAAILRTLDPTQRTNLHGYALTLSSQMRESIPELTHANVLLAWLSQGVLPQVSDLPEDRELGTMAAIADDMNKVRAFAEFARPDSDNPRVLQDQATINQKDAQVRVFASQRDAMAAQRDALAARLQRLHLSTDPAASPEQDSACMASITKQQCSCPRNASIALGVVCVVLLIAAIVFVALYFKERNRCPPAQRGGRGGQAGEAGESAPALSAAVFGGRGRHPSSSYIPDSVPLMPPTRHLQIDTSPARSAVAAAARSGASQMEWGFPGLEGSMSY